MTAQELPYGIDGISDVMTLVRAGRIRTGEVIAEKGKEHPKRWDCFNFADAPKVAEYFAKKAGIPMKDASDKWVPAIELSRQLKVRELDFLFPIDDKRQVLDQAYMKYGASGAWSCRGDGVMAFDRDADAEHSEHPCDGEDCDFYQAKKCKRISLLSVVLYNISGGLTIYDIYSSGRQTAKNLSSGVDLLKIRFGQINNIPLKLYIRPYKTFYIDQSGASHKTVPYCLMIDFEASLLDIEMMKRQAGQQVLMPAPPEQLPDDMYAKSLQEAAALPPAEDAEVIEAPPLAAVPEAEPEPEVPVAEELAPDVLEGYDDDPVYQQARGGMDILELDRTERLELLYKFRDDADGLMHHLGAVIDSQLVDVPPPTPKPGRKPAENPPIETPANAQGRWGF